MCALVIFIVNIAHYLFNDILQGDYAACPSELVDHNSYMYVLAAEIFQKIVYHPALRHKIRLSKQCLPREIIITLSDIWQQILAVQHTLD